MPISITFKMILSGEREMLQNWSPQYCFVQYGKQDKGKGENKTNGMPFAHRKGK